MEKVKEVIQEHMLDKEEMINTLKAEQRKSKEGLWNNKYYVLYKILIVLCITIALCVAMILNH